MRFKDYIFNYLKNQKQNLQDAVIDIPRQTYAVVYSLILNQKIQKSNLKL